MITRREMLAGAAMFALVAGCPAPLLAAEDRPSPALARLLKTVSQIVLPRSDTPGAGDVGLSAFLTLAFAHGLEGTRKPWHGAPPHWPLRADGSLRHDRWLEQELARRAGGNFLGKPHSAQVALLRALDAEAFPPGPPPTTPTPWVAIKALILIGYYSSEAGASQELQYNLIPGRWDADVPLKPDDRAFSSDWTAVEFG